jgi:ankyrin repeat protein
MDTLPLPPRPDLAQYRKRAKELVKAAGSPDENAVRVWGEDWVQTLARLRAETPSPFVRHSYERAVEEIERRAAERVSLADAQRLIARAHGFATWHEFAEHVELASRADGARDPFEAAADAVVTGDVARLASLLRGNPGLVRARSARRHRATLLHYVAANGVEDFRQLTPPDAVAIATSLLEAGAEVDALAETYGGGTAQTTLNLLVSSVHPAEAGLQPALVETLLDHGAAIDGLENDGSPLMTALAFGYGEAAEALARRGARVDNVLAAAALGRVDLVRSLLGESSGVGPSLARLYWLGLTKDPEKHVERAFVWACAYGRTEVVEALLEHGVDPAVADGDGMTGLHWAAANGHLDVVRLLTQRGAPLEARNRWGGTVLTSTLHFALERPEEADRQAAVVALLVEANADAGAVTHAAGIELLRELLSHHG